MGKGDKQGGVLVKVGKDIQLQNPLTMLKTRYLECETVIKNWFVKQSLPAAVAVVTSFGIVVGGVSGYYLSTDLPLKINSKSPIGPIFTGGGRLLQACNGDVLIGANSGISCFMEKLRGKEDVQSSLVAGFGAGVMASLVCGIHGTNAIKNGVYYALFYGATFKVNEKWSQRPKKHDQYEKMKDMLSSLDLNRYEKNFKKGLLTDKTLPLINDSDLQEVKIPVGARRLILDHIQREEVMK
ncbi:mitochondrial import inner membrane translocase subunit TIM22 [Artemisia annua]|uniref:Mitochondrial import inner membrane translocase subunit TIM22 n=1 Tax=Artemisia annua TaxID=35608 RepID=A0A2U1MQI9_ARTAN|nr:mitochondrial import inner membrane translocase subunit TIM22 [Artemisia annua]